MILSKERGKEDGKTLNILLEEMHMKSTDVGICKKSFPKCILEYFVCANS